jgi:ketosteroid isomerase-like protein
MSQENVEIITAAIDAWNREDWDAALKDLAPDAELDFSRAIGPRHGVYRRDQLQEFWADFTELWESARIEPQEFIQAGEQVVVPWTLHTLGREGIEVQARPCFVWTIRDGTVVHVCMYQERREALQAVGLSE